MLNKISQAAVQRGPTYLNSSVHKRSEGGFTLIELMITVALAAIVMTMGVPSFREAIRNTRLATQTNEFVTALNFARSEAIKRRTRVTVCRSNGGGACTTAGVGWQTGWLVFTDPDNDASLDAGETLVWQGAGLAQGYTLTAAAMPNYISFLPNGATRTTAGLIQNGTLQLRDSTGTKGRDIVINTVGRLRLVKVP